MHSSSLNMNPNLFVSVSVLLEYVRVSIQTTQMVYNSVEWCKHSQETHTRTFHAYLKALLSDIDHAARRYTSYSQLTIANLIFSSVAKQMQHLSNGCCVRSVPPRLFCM